jgi:hypothetical protein
MIIPQYPTPNSIPAIKELPTPNFLYIGPRGHPIISKNTDNVERQKIEIIRFYHIRHNERL